MSHHKSIRTLLLVVSVALALAGCSGDKKDDDKAGTPTTSSTPTGTPTTSVSLPAGATLTAPGTSLDFGQEAIVEYSPNQRPGTVLSLIVDDARKGALSDLKGFELNTDYKKNGSYYYVDVTVKNLGTVDAGGWGIPISGVNEADVLLPAVRFTSVFKPCASKSLPKKFPQNSTFSTCMVFLAPNHGQLTALSFPSPDADATKSITWTGDVQPATKASKKPKKKS
jgi:hypothetical protein